MQHFEELWEACENFQEKEGIAQDASTILDLLGMKINLYRMISEKADIPAEERTAGKSRIFGEILLTLSSLSLLEKINVFLSMGEAYQSHQLLTFAKKHALPNNPS
jgi:hypothetical protein